MSVHPFDYFVFGLLLFLALSYVVFGGDVQAAAMFVVVGAACMAAVLVIALLLVWEYLNGNLPKRSDKRQ